ncbi:glycosyltransferase [Geoglobus acetivorans]
MEMISAILPAYNEEDIIENVLHETARTLNWITSRWEILVVDDGSIDSTPEIVKKFAKTDNRVKILSYGKNMGKGFALRYGFQHSRGDLVIFMDADLELHPRKIIEFIEIMREEGADIVVGSKRHPKSKVAYPLKRKILSNVYFLLVKILFDLDVKDTQTGLKLFKRDVLADVIPRILVKRYAFDVELLANSVRRGYKIVEAPVELNFRHNSHVNWKEVWKILVDTMAIAYRMHIKRYYD